MHCLSVEIVLEYLKSNPLNKQKSGRPAKKPDKWILEQIFKVLRTGMQWEAVGTPEIHYTTIYKRFRQWSDLGIFQKSYQYRLQKLRKAGKVPLTNLSLDSTLIKNVRGQDCLGRNSCDRGRKGCKISLLVTEQGIPLSILGAPANRHDSKLALDTVNQSPIKLGRNRILADKAYNSLPLKKDFRKRNLTLIYPLKRNQKGKKRESQRKQKLLKTRSSVERVFGWVKSYRRITLRQESRMQQYLEFWYLALLEILLVRTS